MSREDLELTALLAKEQIKDDMRLGVALLALLVALIFGLGFLAGWLSHGGW